MSKRKSRRQSSPRPAAPRPTDVPARPTTAAASVSVAPSKDLREEYRYVIMDLRRIAIVAAAMFALLVVLALFLT